MSISWLRAVFFRVARTAQGEQVIRVVAAPIPLRDDVMDDLSSSSTPGTPGVFSQEGIPDGGPFIAVPTLGGGASIPVLALPFLALMIVAEAPPPTAHQIGTSRVGASAGGQVGHNSYSSPR